MAYGLSIWRLQHQTTTDVVTGRACEINGRANMNRFANASVDRNRSGVALWLAALCLSVVSPAAGQSGAPEPKQVRILFIGNSYTSVNDLPRILGSVAAAGRQAIIVDVGSVLEGGASLRTHWNNETIKLIQSGAWDYVVLQEQSLLPIEEPDRFIAYGKRFASEIRAAKANLVLYLTWSRRSRPADQELLNRAYLQLARETGAIVAPVGPAWQVFRELDANSELYAEDGSHPSPLGSFIAASTFYRALFSELPADSTGAEYGIEPRTLTLIRRAVEATVTRSNLR